MGQLSKKTGNNLVGWSTGYAEFGPKEFLFHKVMVCVTCQVENFKRRDPAFLDTGSEFPIIGGELARRLKNRPIERERVKVHTWLGDIVGDIVRLTITLIADEGEDLPIESSVLLTEDWDEPEIVLGYDGFLNRVRVALDPGLEPQGQKLFYFGK